MLLLCKRVRYAIHRVYRLNTETDQPKITCSYSVSVYVSVCVLHFLKHVPNHNHLHCSRRLGGEEGMETEIFILSPPRQGGYEFHHQCHMFAMFDYMLGMTSTGLHTCPQCMIKAFIAWSVSWRVMNTSGHNWWQITTTGREKERDREGGKS